jgi:hypothetical protein
MHGDSGWMVIKLNASSARTSGLRIPDGSPRLHVRGRWVELPAGSGFRADTLNSNFRHFERAAEGRRNQIRISHFERDLGELMTFLHRIRTVGPFEQI